MQLCQSENVILIEMWCYENLYPQTRVSFLHVFPPMKTDIFFLFLNRPKKCDPKLQRDPNCNLIQWKLIMFFFSSTEVECLWRKWMSKLWISKARTVPTLLNGFPTMWRQLFATFHPVAQKWLRLSLETPLQFKVLWSGSYKMRFKITRLILDWVPGFI